MHTARVEEDAAGARDGLGAEERGSGTNERHPRRDEDVALGVEPVGLNSRVGEQAIEALRRQEEQQHHPGDDHLPVIALQTAYLVKPLFFNTLRASESPPEVTLVSCLPDPLITGWLAALEVRHLADLTMSEVARALRALSSCYVERRAKLAEGGALSSSGKRAAFALFYGPQHLLVTQEILRSLPSGTDPLNEIVDLGCGTGAAGVAWALAARARSIRGFDRHPWAIAEASWTYRQFQLQGRALHANIADPRQPHRQSTRQPTDAAGRRGTGVLAAYSANELAPEGRAVLLTSLLEAHARGSRVLVIEPIARRALPWWGEWQTAVERAGGRADEWRFAVDLPPTQLALARAAGLAPRELTARSLFL